MCYIDLRRLKHERFMDVVDEQSTLTVATCSQDNQYDHVTWYE
jgi:hypothetical protein